MSINLITGVPGSGKSVLAMTFIQNLLLECRPLYVHGIPDLLIPHTQVLCNSLTCEVCPNPPLAPDEPLILDWNSREDQKKQYEIDYKNYLIEDEKYQFLKLSHDSLLKADEWHLWAPDGALLVYDEVQNIYRPRSSSSKVPPSVSAFETHRHKGLDFYLITQSPLLFDSNIRRLVGKHIHLRPTWAGRYQYEFPECNDNTRVLSSGIKSKYKLNKSVFSLYKSSNLHTKQTKKVPFIAYLFIFIIIAFILLAFRVKGRLDQPVSDINSIPDTKLSTHNIYSKPEILESSVLSFSNESEEPLKHYSMKDLQRLSVVGISIDSFNRLPSTCFIFTKNTVKCNIPRFMSKMFSFSVCMPEICYTLITINSPRSYDTNNIGTRSGFNS